MPGTRRISLLALVIAGLLTGCGSGDETVPEANAERLLALVEGIQEDVDAKRCDLVAAQAEQFASEIETLPDDVDEEVREELTQAGSRLVDLADDPSQCEGPETGATGDAGVEPAPVPAPVPEPPPPPAPEPVPEEEAPEEEPEEEAPSQAGSGQGGPPASPGGGASPQTGGVGGGAPGGGE